MRPFRAQSVTARSDTWNSSATSRVRRNRPSLSGSGAPKSSATNASRSATSPPDRLLPPERWPSSPDRNERTRARTGPFWSGHGVHGPLWLPGVGEELGDRVREKGRCVLVGGVRELEGDGVRLEGGDLVGRE